MDKYARDTFIHNYGEPKYYPKNVYDREIPSESIDIYMTSPPCQAFSLAGKRLGKDDKRGVLFFNSHEFIQINKPRFFIFENVKGLLSDDGGKTFQEWINMLGGKSVNGLPVLFPHEDSVPYHLYWQVLNSKNHGVPQNRERVFLIGIRDEKDNQFQFPKEEHLCKLLKDVIDNDVDDKYFLSTKVLNQLMLDNHKVKSATLKGYEIANEGDSINFSVPSSKTRRGRVGKGVAQTLDTGCNQGVISYTRDAKGKVVSRHINQQANTIHTATGGGGNTDQFYTDGFRIRRLTPRECFRLMDFPDTFTWNVSDSQAYKQAGNSIVVNVLCKIINQLKIY
jgi:DNA (cytosine-5)-methyltransferase 1